MNERNISSRNIENGECTAVTISVDVAFATGNDVCGNSAGFTYNYAITKYFALGHGVRFKVDIVIASNGYNDELRPKQIEYSSNVEYDFDDVEDRRWNVNGGFTFSIVDQFMFGSIKNKQLAAVIDLLYRRTASKYLQRKI